MDAEKPGSYRSRRRFLRGGASALAGGLVGGAAYAAVAAPSSRKAGSSPALPWAWRRVDPMEAGSRAYRYYHDVGG
jgi:hypothetical protein